MENLKECIEVSGTKCFVILEGCRTKVKREMCFASEDGFMTKCSSRFYKWEDANRIIIREEIC